MTRKIEIITQEFSRITSLHGGVLRPKTIVDEARPRASPLHPFFEWDDAIAGEKYRLEQAREMIREVEVVVQGPRLTKVTIRKYHSLRSDRLNGDSYRPVVEILKNETFKKQMLLEALRDMQAFEARYQKYQEMARLFRSAPWRSTLERLSRPPKKRRRTA